MSDNFIKKENGNGEKRDNNRTEGRGRGTVIKVPIHTVNMREGEIREKKICTTSSLKKGTLRRTTKTKGFWGKEGREC